MQMHIHSFAWLVLLLSPYALSAETIAPEPAFRPANTDCAISPRWQAAVDDRQVDRSRCG